MRLQEVVARIEATDEIPTLGTVAAEVMRLAGEESTDFNAMGRVIEGDPALTARILKVANSPYYGLRGEVANVERAVALLGLAEVRDIALSVSVIAGISEELADRGFRWEAFWEHSSGCALIAKSLVRLLGLSTGGQEFAAALLHDVGKILLGHHFPADFAEALRIAAEDAVTMEEAELRVFGTDHGRLGGWLTTRWGFPHTTVQAIAHHHHPERASEAPALAATVHLADLLAKAKCIGFGGDDVGVCLSDDPAWAMLAQAAPGSGEFDWERFTFLLDQEVDAARDLIEAARRAP